MKRFTFLILSLLLAMGLSGCAAKPEDMSEYLSDLYSDAIRAVDFYLDEGDYTTACIHIHRISLDCGRYSPDRKDKAERQYHTFLSGRITKIKMSLALVYSHEESVASQAKEDLLAYRNALAETIGRDLR